jgi:transposase-like protein
MIVLAPSPPSQHELGTSIPRSLVYKWGGERGNHMETNHRNGVASATAARSKDLEVLERPRRRRFTTEEKLRILRETDACAPGTIGGVLRRQGLCSSLLAAWRQARDRGDLDPGALRPRAKHKANTRYRDVVLPSWSARIARCNAVCNALNR